jgi:hypothetical protein
VRVEHVGQLALAPELAVQGVVPGDGHRGVCNGGVRNEPPSLTA